MGQAATAQVPGLNQFKNLLAMVRNAGNPALMLESVLQNNPQYQQAMSLDQQNGGDAKAAFYKLARQKGIDPNEILDQLR